MRAFLLCLLTFFVGSCVASNVTKDQTIIVASKKNVDSPSLGFCKNNEGFVNLRELFFLKNTDLIINKNGYNHKVVIDGENILLSVLDEKYNILETAIVEMDFFIGDRDYDLSLLLKGSEVFVFWKETFLHSSYKQGLLHINNMRLEPLCEGVGGIKKSH